MCLILLTACSPSSDGTTTTSSLPLVTSTTTATGTEGDACAGGGLAFRSEGLVATVGDAGSDATRIGGIRWQPAPSCERFVIEFATESDSPASSLGLTGVTMLAGAGIVRVSLPEAVAATSVADLVSDGALTSRLYVVREADGSLFIDIHGASEVPLGARAFAQSSPARLIIDLVAVDDSPIPVGSAVSDVSVVPSPLPGPALYPLTIEAYAQPALRSIRLLLIDDESITVDRAIALPGGTDAWQSLSSRLDDGPSGVTTLFIGTADANGRPADGATVTIDLP